MIIDIKTVALSLLPPYYSENAYPVREFGRDTRECRDRNDTFVLLFQKLNIVKKSSESILTIPTALPIPTNKDEWEKQGHTNVHRLYSDIWGCDSCNFKTDRHYFNRSSCTRNKKE